MRRLASADFLLFTCVALWGLNVPITKLALEHGFTPLAYGSIRFAIATVMFVGFMAVRGERVRVSGRDGWLIVAWGAVVITVNQVGFNESFRYASPPTISLLFGTLPIFAGIYAQALGFEKLGARRWLGAGVSFGGVALVAAGAPGGISGSIGGIALSLVAPITFAAYSLAYQPFVRRHGSLRVNALGSLAAVGPFVLVAGPQLLDLHWGALDAAAWACLAYSALVAYVLTNILWFGGIGKVGAARATVYGNAQPFLGALFASALLSDPVGWQQWVGGVLIALGIGASRLNGARGAVRRLPVMRRFQSAAEAVPPPHE